MEAEKEDLKIEYVDIKKIKPYWRNPRKSDKAIEELKKSIQKFGFNVPLVLDKNYTIITGHARYRALQQLGIKKVPCIVKDLDEKKAREYRIADNKISELSTWDYNYLRKELMELEEVVGFSKEEIEKIIKLQEEKSITQKDIERVKKKMDNKFVEMVMKEEDNLVTIICPFCMKEFEVKKSEILFSRKT